MDKNKLMIAAAVALVLAVTATQALAADCRCGRSADGGGITGDCDLPTTPATCQSGFCPAHGYVATSMPLQTIAIRNQSALFDELRQQHRQVGALMQQIANSRPSQRADLYNQFRMALIPHMKAEEATLYAALEQTRSGHAGALMAEEEHHAAANVLGELEATPISNDRWMARFLALRDMINHHVAKEEGIIFNQARQAFNRNELDMLYVQFNTQQQRIAATLTPATMATSLNSTGYNNNGLSTTATYDLKEPSYNSMENSSMSNTSFDQHMGYDPWNSFNSPTNTDFNSPASSGPNSPASSNYNAPANTGTTTSSQ